MLEHAKARPTTITRAKNARPEQDEQAAGQQQERPLPVNVAVLVEQEHPDVLADAQEEKPAGRQQAQEAEEPQVAGHGPGLHRDDAVAEAVELDEAAVDRAETSSTASSLSF